MALATPKILLLTYFMYFFFFFFPHLSVSSMKAGTFAALVVLFLSPSPVLDDSRCVFLVCGFSTSAL